jgi:hypothetical protein
VRKLSAGTGARAVVALEGADHGVSNPAHAASMIRQVVDFLPPRAP